MNFNTLSGVQHAVQNTDTFLALLQKRRESYRLTEQRLKEFVVFGGWELDCFGQLKKMTLQNKGKEISLQQFLDYPPSIVMPSSVFWDDVFKKELKDKTVISSIFSANRIPLGKKCPICKEGWTLQNFYDFIPKEKNRYPFFEFLRRKDFGRNPTDS